MADAYTKLKKNQEKFLDNAYFSASSIITPKSEWLTIDITDKNIDLKIEKAKEMQVFNLVVEHNGTVIGSINALDLENYRSVMKEDIKYYKIPYSMTLFKLAEMMRKDSENVKRERSPLYFVYDTHDHEKVPIGLMTFWDLNRAPSYILTYPMLVYLEHLILLSIRDSHKEWEDHSNLLHQLDNPNKHVKSFVKGPRCYDYDALSRLGFRELTDFYRKDIHVSKNTKEIPDILIDSFLQSETFRNRVGHSIRLLIRDDDVYFKEDLDTICRIWNQGRKLFINFLGPKVKHSAPMMYSQP